MVECFFECARLEFYFPWPQLTTARLIYCGIINEGLYYPLKKNAVAIGLNPRGGFIAACITSFAKINF